MQKLTEYVAENICDWSRFLFAFGPTHVFFLKFLGIFWVSMQICANFIAHAHLYIHAFTHDKMVVIFIGSLP